MDGTPDASSLTGWDSSAAFSWYSASLVPSRASCVCAARAASPPRPAGGRKSPRSA